MAQIIERIVRSEYPPKDKVVIWLDTTDNTLKSLTPNGWTKILDNNKIDALKNVIESIFYLISIIVGLRAPKIILFQMSQQN